MSVHGDRNSGAAKRRRDRRLRMHWRHDQLTLQMVLATVQHPSYDAPRGQRTATRTGERGVREELFGDDPGSPHPPARALQLLRARRGSQGRSRTLRRKRGLCGTPWSTGLKRAPSCRSPMLQCRRVGTSWWSSICRSLSWLSKCPRSLLHPVVLATARFPWCRRRNSWWKCLRSFPILLCTGLWSRTLTFQFLMVVTVWAGRGEEVFKVYAQDRIQQRFVEQKTLTFQFFMVVAEVEVFKVYALDRIQQRFLEQPNSGGTRRSMCGSRWLTIRPGGTCCRIRRYTGMSMGDGFLGFHIGYGCFFLVAGRRAWCWRAVFLVCPLAQRRTEQPLALRLFHARRCTTTGAGWFSAALESFFMRQSTAASGRISCISCSRGSHMEIWRIISSGFAPGSLVFGVWVLPAEYEKLDLLGDDFSYVRNAWLDSEYLFCISTDASGEFHIFSTAK